MKLKKELNIIKWALVCALIFTLAVGWATKIYSERTQGKLAQSVIRFHVLANSDSGEDQALKLKVRDGILSLLGPELSKTSSVGEARSLIQSRVPEIEAEAGAIIRENGYGYNATASVASVFFPTKTYGDLTFFPGEYEALRVVIGEGGGQNWWCVMFPPLCFVDAAKGNAQDAAKEQLRTSVEKEYMLLSDDSREKNVTVNVRFKIVELWQNLMRKDKPAIKPDGYVLKNQDGQQPEMAKRPGLMEQVRKRIDSK